MENYIVLYSIQNAFIYIIICNTSNFLPCQMMEGLMGIISQVWKLIIHKSSHTRSHSHYVVRICPITRVLHIQSQCFFQKDHVLLPLQLSCITIITMLIVLTTNHIFYRCTVFLVCFTSSITIFSLLKKLKGKRPMITAVSRKLFR